jgi:hypothetical protein
VTGEFAQLPSEGQDALLRRATPDWLTLSAHVRTPWRWTVGLRTPALAQGVVACRQLDCHRQDRPPGPRLINGCTASVCPGLYPGHTPARASSD